MNLNNIRIILYQPSHPGNIGATARAMWTMGLSSLYLVQPKSFPDDVATRRASGAEHLLQQAHVVQTVDEALSDCGLILGTSAQSRHVAWPQLSPKECAQRVLTHSSQQNVAILFGPERTGLTNEEVQRCHYQVAIPANPSYSSLNLSMAVQIIAYEIYDAALGNARALLERPLANAQEMQSFYGHLDHMLDVIHFRKPSSSPQLLSRLKRLFDRAELDTDELNLLRGILKTICNAPST